MAAARGMASAAASALGSGRATGDPFRVLVSGASGMLGQALTHSLEVAKPANRFQPDVHTLVRHAPQHANQIYWDPYEGVLDAGQLEGFDAVVHLAGEAPVTAPARANFR